MTASDREADIAAKAREEAKNDLAERGAQLGADEDAAAEPHVPFADADLGFVDDEDRKDKIVTTEEMLLQSTPQSQVDVTVRTAPQDLVDLGHAPEILVEPTVSDMAITGPLSGRIVKDNRIPPGQLPGAWQDPAIATPGLPTDDAIRNVATHGSVMAPAEEDTADAKERKAERSRGRKAVNARR